MQVRLLLLDQLGIYCELCYLLSFPCAVHVLSQLQWKKRNSGGGKGGDFAASHRDVWFVTELDTTWLSKLKELTQRTL